MRCLVAWAAVAPVGGQVIDEEFWNRCKACTTAGRVFCYTTGECLDLSIDAPSEALWGACMNPLLIPDSCRTKGIHPPKKEDL
mmetsp:Transcript_25178/g.60971  ORF Transcript_25178/g.60971 Transcript_25178/m.60971 type:complete len:83 (-) Transcript_25178:37-285(-)